MQGMADHLRRAARQPAYEVHEILEGTPALDLGVRFVSGDYLEAVDAAFAYLDEHDPNRTGAVSGVEIHRIREDDARETVWRYGHSDIRPPEDLTAHWGFDVTQAWFRRDAAA
jgi:hypothetical protein